MLQRIKIVAVMTVTTAMAQTPMADGQSALVPMKDYVPPSDLDNIPSLYYPTNYRILDCWECFEAQGKICIDKSQDLLFQFTESSNPGNAFCCKPDNTEGFCKSGSKHFKSTVSMTTICSEPSYGGLTSAARGILTDNRNHQMFAFCPFTSQQICGIPSSQSAGGTGLAILAGLNEQTISTSELRYQRPTPTNPDTEREYDACYYEILPDLSLTSNNEYNLNYVNFKLTESEEMNVYIYGGTGRENATRSIVSGNRSPTVGSTYSVQISKDVGLLVVAYPNKGKTNTRLSFTYSLDATKQDGQNSGGNGDNGNTNNEQQNNGQQQSESNNSGTEQGSTEGGETVEEESNDVLFYVLCAGAGVLLIIIITLCLVFRNRRNQEKIRQGQHYPQKEEGRTETLELGGLGDDEGNHTKQPLGTHGDQEFDKMEQKAFSGSEAAVTQD